MGVAAPSRTSAKRPSHGAATPLLHVVDAGAEGAMRTGMRVRARWAEQPAGAITDIQAFEPA